MPAKPKVFVSRIIPEAGLQLIREGCDAEVWQDFDPPARVELMRRAPELDGIVSLLTDGMDAEFMDAAPRLRVISNYAVGYDNVDVGAATQRGIPVGHTPGVLTETTADFAFTLLMATARRVVEGMDYVRSGQWSTWGPLLLLGQDVHHAALGLIGLGRIGTEMAKRAKGFDMRVIYYDAFRNEAKEAELGLEFLPLEDVLRQADFVSLHTPLTPDTHHLMNARTLKLMKPTAILINTSRGPVIDADALYDALKAGTICAAGLDVTDPEPLPKDHKLLTLRNLTVVPHIASASVATRDAMAVLAAENLFAGLEGRPLKATPNPDVKPRFS